MSCMLVMYTGSDDYESISATLTFSETTNSSCVELQFVNDLIHEANETLSIQLATSDADVFLDPTSIEVTIVNDDPGLFEWCILFICFTLLYIVKLQPLIQPFNTIVFFQLISNDAICEGVSEVEVCVILNSEIETDVLVNIGTEDISASQLSGTFVGKEKTDINFVVLRNINFCYTINCYTKGRW